MTNFNGIELDVANAGNNELNVIIENHRLCNNPDVKGLFIYDGDDTENAKDRNSRVAAAQAVCINCVALEACDEFASRLPRQSLFGVHAGVEYGARSTTVEKYRQQMKNLIATTKK